MPHYLNNGLVDGGEVSALRAGRDLLPMNIPSTHFCQKLSQPQGLVRLEGLGKQKKRNDLIETRTSGIPACSIAPEPSILQGILRNQRFAGSAATPPFNPWKRSDFCLYHLF
jgi:hypothetical protein